jgi:hypothetical protein
MGHHAHCGGASRTIRTIRAASAAEITLDNGIIDLLYLLTVGRLRFCRHKAFSTYPTNWWSVIPKDATIGQAAIEGSIGVWEGGFCQDLVRP